MRNFAGDKVRVCLTPTPQTPDVLTLTYLGLNNINSVFALFALKHLSTPYTAISAPAKLNKIYFFRVILHGKKTKIIFNNN